MKKLSFFLMAMLFSVMSFAAEAKFDWSGITTTQSPTVANVYTQGDVTLTFEKASGSNIPAENKEGSIRMYKGTTLKIVVAGENNVITNVAFTCTGASYAATNLQYNGVALPSNEWALTTPAAEILLNAAANARFKSIVVTYGQVAADYIAAPAISGDVDFIESTEVSIAAGEGLKVYYTLDGTDPTNASPEYTAPFEVKETTTVKAIAYNGENASEVTTQTFTKATQVTCAEAKEIALKVSGNNVPTELTYVVKGYVTNIVGDWKSGKQTFWIADTKDGGKVFEAYYCFISEAVTLGDYVQLFGKLTKYNTTPEMADGQATILPEPAPEPVMETVYFVNAGNWTTVNVYAWTTDPNASWPGVAATKEAEQIAGYDVYSYTAEAGKYANVIFNNGSGAQTADLVWTAGKYYVKDGWYTKEEAEAQLAKPVEYESVYFVDNQGWGKANIYTWTPQVGTWPGVAMTKEVEQLAGYDVYSYTVEKGTSFGGVIFNNGSGVQTGDLKWTAGKYYVKDAWYTKEEAIEKLSGPVTPPVITYVLMGVKGDWKTGIAMTQNPDNANEYVLLGQEILEGDSVKVVTLTDGVATAWCGNVDEYSPVEYTNAEGNGNIVLAPGKYDFYYKVAEDLIYIGGEAYKPEIEWLEMPLEITNLTTEVMEVEGAKYLQLMGRDDMNDADVTLFLNNYADVDDDYEVNAESSYMTFGGLELTVLEGVMTQTSETDKGTMYNGIVRTYVAEDSLYVAFNLTMYAAPATVLELTDAIVAINEDLGTLTFNVPTGEGEGYFVELSGYTAPGVHEGPQICLFETPEVVAYTNYAETSVADGVITLKGEFTSFMGAKFDLTISGKLPVEEPEVIEYVLNGGVLPLVGPTNAELWEMFKPYYNTYYGLNRADQAIDKVSTFAATYMQKIMTDEASEYKWLGDYVQSVATAAGVPLSTDMASANESGWRWAVHAFFNAAAGQYGAAGIDFTEAGKPENWVNVYPDAQEVVLPTEPVAEDYVLPTPVKEGYTFVGWYDNAEGAGEAYTVIPAGWAGTLYAIWKQGPTTALENIAVEGKAVKAIINGQLIIIKNGVQYNAQGQVVK